MSQHQDVTSFIAGKVGGGANAGTGLGNIKKGDIFVVNADTSTIMTGGSHTVTNAPNIAIAHCIQDGYPIMSGIISGKALKEGSTKDFIAPVAQVSGFGYHPTVNPTGTLPAAGDVEDEFGGAIVVPTDLRLSPNRQSRHEFNAVSKGGYDLGMKLVRDINRPVDTNPRIGGEKLFFAKLISNGTKTNIGTSATVDVVEGSDSVTFSSAHGLNAGDYVEFPDAGLYTVKAAPSTTVITLNYAYAGVSETIPADTAKEVDTPTLFGIVVNTIVLVPTNPVDKYNQVVFSLAISENLETVESVITAPVTGQGKGWEVRGKEIACMGWSGGTDRLDTMRTEYPFTTSLDIDYNTVSLSALAPIRIDMQQTGQAPVALFFAFDDAAETQRTAVMDILTPWALSGGVDLS